MKRWIQGLAQLLVIFMALAAMKIVLSIDRLIRWAAGQKSLAAFFAISVVPVLFFLAVVFGLWAGYEWGIIALLVVAAGGSIAISALMMTAGRLVRAESREGKAP